MIGEKIGDGAYLSPDALSTGAQKMQLGNLLIQFGDISVKTTTAMGNNKGADYFGATTLTFPIAFSSAPVILTNVVEVARYWFSAASSITTTSARISIGGNTNNSTKTVHWIAVGYKE